MNDEIGKKLEELILKALKEPNTANIERAGKLIDIRATVAHIKNMEKR